MELFNQVRLNKSLQLKLRNFFLILLAFFPILPYGILTIVTVLFVIFSLISDFDLNKFNKKNHFIFLSYTGFFLLLIGSTLYSTNLKAASDLIIRMCPLVIFPFISVYSFNAVELAIIKKIKICFLISVFIVIAIIFYFAYLELRIVGFDKLFYWATLTRATEAVEFLDLHPSYISIYIALCIYLLLENKNIYLLYKVLLTSLLIIIVIILSSRAAFMAISVSSIIALFVFIKANPKIKIIASVVLMISTIYLFSTSNYLRAGFKVTEIIKKNYEIKSQNPNSNEIRIVIINCFLNQLSGKYFLGIGVGDLQDSLNNCYDESANKYMRNLAFNTHNNYLFFLGSAGVFCVLLFMYMLIFNIRIALKRKQMAFFMFLITMCVVFLFENILSRSYGVTFLSYFILVFNLEGLKQKKSITG